MRTLECLVLTNQNIAVDDFKNSHFIVAEAVESAIEKIQAIEFDLIFIDQTLIDNSSIKLDGIIKFQQPESKVFYFMDSDEIEMKVAEAVKMTKAEGRNYSFNDDVFKAQSCQIN